MPEVSTSGVRSRVVAVANAATADEWLDSPFLARVASRVARTYGLLYPDAADLLQELRIAIWKAGRDVSLNSTWIFHTAMHKASDLATRNRDHGCHDASQLIPRTASTSRDSDLTHLLRARADRLPDRIRRFYDLRYREGLSQREISLRLGLCRSSVRWLESQCTQLMKGSLERSRNV